MVAESFSAYLSQHLNLSAKPGKKWEDRAANIVFFTSRRHKAYGVCVRMPRFRLSWYVPLVLPSACLTLTGKQPHLYPVRLLLLRRDEKLYATIVEHVPFETAIHSYVCSVQWVGLMYVVRRPAASE
jgi:hypothetical protein